MLDGERVTGVQIFSSICQRSGIRLRSSRRTAAWYVGTGPTYFRF